jgi:hypothetical protein
MAGRCHGGPRAPGRRAPGPAPGGARPPAAAQASGPARTSDSDESSGVAHAHAAHRATRPNGPVSPSADGAARHPGPDDSATMTRSVRVISNLKTLLAENASCGVQS